MCIRDRIYPVLLILLNSLKIETAISTSTVFALPNAQTFAGLANYVTGVTQMNFLSSFGYSLIITVTSVLLILLCCSMCGWYITRVQTAVSRAMYLLCVFSMVVPFQMVMFTLSKTADSLRLNTPFNICIIYLGFGAGLAVFMFTGFMKSVPVAIEAVSYTHLDVYKRQAHSCAIICPPRSNCWMRGPGLKTAPAPPRRLKCARASPRP